MHPRRPTSVPGSQPSDPGHASRPRLTCPGHPAIRRGTREPPVLEASRRGSTTLPHVARCRTPGARRRFRVRPRADRARRQVPGDTQTMLTRARGTDSTILLVIDRVEPSRSGGTLRIEPTPIGGASTPAPPTPPSTMTETEPRPTRFLQQPPHSPRYAPPHIGGCTLRHNCEAAALFRSAGASAPANLVYRSNPPELCGVACPASLHGLPLAAAYPRPRQWLSPYASEPALLPRRHFHHPSEHVPQVPRRGFRRLRRLKSPADTSQPDFTWPNSVYGQFSRIMEDSPPPINNRESTIVHKLVDTIHRKN